ncbi:unnamed protein product [Hermetia illucens]|uniref:Histone acetyltransferase n=1 Tax=Hermetia illucens TaxID=343691 RepID=A0A7R8UFJ9_HERIL|nr:unnamed protein product [Hermetia illucens]
MSSRKKSTSTEESSSGSTSDSSSSSGSSSGSGSGSSSSDSESSSSVDEKTTRGSPRPNDTSTTSNSGTKAGSAPDKVLRRRSSDIRQNKSDEKAHTNQKAKSNVANRGQRLSKSSVYSSDDEPSPAKKPAPRPNLSTDRRKITETRRSTHGAPAPPPPITGGKAPPAIVKQQQQQNLAKNAAARRASNNRPPSPKSSNKSIFSPENSSDSDEKRPAKGGNKSVAAKTKPPPKTRPGIVPQKKAAPVKKDDSKSSDSSESTSSSDHSSSSSGSEDSDSSDGDSSPPAKRPPPPPRKANPKTGKVDPGKTVVLSDSEAEQPPTVTRKFTRSASTRKSKHLTGKASDSDSDPETDKRSNSRSPVKRAPITTTKSKANAKRDNKVLTTPLPLATPPVPEEQKCPVMGCDSSGHLNGNLDKHFLPEACPIFHNITSADAKARAADRKLREEERKKMFATIDPTRKIQTSEQRIYQQKIREIRESFKPSTPTPPGAMGPGGSSLNNDKTKKDDKEEPEREPKVEGLVPEYDLQLFRDAQAIASEKMEKEIKDLPVGKGTKYIVMGKYQMKVWYQSPYPDDAARLPKMYICEFCLRYQKSEVGIKRHSAKCVWRHPPGDEIYRKSKLQVWQVDGKRHKQYCQHLCLLAKFFLDHKTLYYDVEPFLFYVMTLVDSEGCHIVGYFSKEKNSFLNYNVSCILTLPPYQRKGYGRLLIDFRFENMKTHNSFGFQCNSSLIHIALFK